MNSIVCLALFIAGASAASPLLNALTKRDNPSCPAPSGMISICIFIKGVNCLADSECTDGKVCCSEGCGKVCKHPKGSVKREVIHQGTCPDSHPDFFGHCLFFPDLMCHSDGDCASHEKCCHEGCAKICKKAL